MGDDEFPFVDGAHWIQRIEGRPPSEWPEWVFLDGTWVPFARLTADSGVGTEVGTDLDDP